MKNLLDLKRDLNQPRKFFDRVKLQELADSILSEGIINPIEIDKDNVIITGERRWQAAKLIGLKEIPCKIIEPRNRLNRQIIENLQMEGLSDMEQAKAFKILLSSFPGKLDNSTGGWPRTGIIQLSKQLGRSASNIIEKLSLLEQPKSFRDRVESGEIKGSTVRAINIAPEKYKGKIREMIVDKKIKTRDGAIAVALGLKQAPHKAEEILSQDYSKDDSYTVEKKVAEFIPLSDDQLSLRELKISVWGGEDIIKSCKLVVKEIEKMEFEKLNRKRKDIVSRALINLIKKINDFMDGYIPKFIDS